MKYIPFSKEFYSDIQKIRPKTMEELYENAGWPPVQVYPEPKPLFSKPETMEELYRNAGRTKYQYIPYLDRPKTQNIVSNIPLSTLPSSIRENPLLPTAKIPTKDIPIVESIPNVYPPARKTIGDILTGGLKTVGTFLKSPIFTQRILPLSILTAGAVYGRERPELGMGIGKGMETYYNLKREKEKEDLANIRRLEDIYRERAEWDENLRLRAIEGKYESGESLTDEDRAFYKLRTGVDISEKKPSTQVQERLLRAEEYRQARDRVYHQIYTGNTDFSDEDLNTLGMTRKQAEDEARYYWQYKMEKPQERFEAGQKAIFGRQDIARQEERKTNIYEATNTAKTFYDQYKYLIGRPEVDKDGKPTGKIWSNRDVVVYILEQMPQDMIGWIGDDFWGYVGVSNPNAPSPIQSKQKTPTSKISSPPIAKPKSTVQPPLDKGKEAFLKALQGER